MIVQHTTWHHFQVRFSEWFCAGLLFCFGLYLATHSDMFARSPNWQGMREMFPQAVWAVSATIIGFARLGALYVNGRHRRTPLIRLIASFFSAFFFTQVVVGLWNAQVPTTGIVTYAFVVGADIYSAFRASADVTYGSKKVRDMRDGYERGIVG